MEREASFETRDGLELYERSWEPQDETRANVVLIHGYGEHCSRYASLAHRFNGSGLAVHTFDQRGFGNSPGRRAYINNFDDVLVDLDCYLAHIRPRLEGKPWFMMGQSYGGLIVGAYAETRDIDAAGLVFCSPFLAFPGDVSKVLVALSGVVGALMPWLPVGDVDTTGLSRDPAVVEEADKDPLNYHGRVRARTGGQFAKAIRRTLANAGAIKAPVLIMHGSEDRVVSPKGSHLLYTVIGSEDRTLRIFDGGYHELWHDLDKDVVLAAICDWIGCHCSEG
ncbi:MAG: alpha/beta fold hydrolase [Nitrospiraceae bacterium]|nr:alpha/beta fold hydrolase [Nitrospiraceae bacterium]